MFFFQREISIITEVSYGVISKVPRSVRDTQSYPGVSWASVEDGHAKRPCILRIMKGDRFLLASRVRVELIGRIIHRNFVCTLLIITENIQTDPLPHTHS